MSKKSIEDILGDMEKEESGETVFNKDNNEKTPVKFKNKKKKNWKRRIILSVLAIFLVIGSVLGFEAYLLAKKMFEGGAAPGLLGFLGQGQLKGEADGRINVLLLGIGGAGHDGANLTDTMMVASIKPQTNEVAMLSVPRDLYVSIPGHGKDKINAANAFGEQDKPGSGISLTSQTVSNTLGIPIHYTARIDFNGFAKIIDTVGGVDINVENDLYDPFYPGGTYSIKKGPHHMNGAEALKYARSRETTSDFDRAKRQQQVMVAMKDKIMTANTLLNPAKMNDILTTLGDHVKTDMQIWEAQKLAQMFQKVDKNKIINRVLDNSEDGPLVSSISYGGAYILLPKTGNFKEVQSIAQNIFTDSGLRTEAAKVQVLNATGVSGQAKKTGDTLSSNGLKVLSVSNASEINSTTVIYDYSGGTKPKTIDFLEKKFCVKAVQKTDPTGSYDIAVVVGKDQVNKD